MSLLTRLQRRWRALPRRADSPDPRRAGLAGDLARELRFGLRQLRRNPGFTAAAILLLAVGIGANTVVFSVARTVLGHRLGFDGEDRLAWIRLVHTASGARETDLSWRDLGDLREGVPAFETVATYGLRQVSWESPGNGGPPEKASALLATPDLGDALRVRPVLGRLLQASDAARDDVVLISQGLWESRFGGRPDVLGQALRVDQRTRTIVGVLPGTLRFPLERAPAQGAGELLRAEQPAFWLPMPEPRGEDLTSRAARMFPAVVRLKPGVPESAARTEARTLGQRLAAAFPATNREFGYELISFRDQILGPAREGIPLLVAAVAAVLLICCLNLANLLLARGVARQRETAVRLALGAGRLRLVRALLAECTLLAALGGLAGLALAGVGLGVIRNLGATSLPFIHEASLDPAALAFTAGASLLTALGFGLLPALGTTRTEAGAALGTGGRATGGPQVRAWQHRLVVGQIATVLALLAAAGLLMESLRRLLGQDLGYRPASVLVLDLATEGEFATNAEVCRMYRALRERLAALPSVESVGTISSTPLTARWTFNERANVVGRPLPEADRPSLAATFVAFDYFQVMGIPLREGRLFRDDELDDDGYGQRVVLNESAARLLFPGQDALGGRFTVASNPDRILEVIGIVQDTRDVRLEERPRPRFYWQYAFSEAQVVLRTSATAQALVPRFHDAVRQTDGRVRIASVRPLSEIVSSTVAERRFLVVLLSTYSLAALGIASVGLFAVMAYQVALRRNEFGVRLALGASPGGLQRLVLARAGRLLGVGLALGLAVSVVSNRLLASQVFGVSPHDPSLLALAAGAVSLAALLAAAIPARRAARIAPWAALRSD